MAYKLSKKDGVVNPIFTDPTLSSLENDFTKPENIYNNLPKKLGQMRDETIEEQPEWIKDAIKDAIKKAIPSMKTTSDWIIEEVEDIKNTLLEKNRKYGNSVFSEGLIFPIDPGLAIKARLNDKFARLKEDNKDEDEDITKDIIGYFILQRIYEKKKKLG